MFEKKPPRRDRNIRTPFRDKARDHSTERVTGAELRKRTRCYRCRQLGHMARECQIHGTLIIVMRLSRCALRTAPGTLEAVVLLSRTAVSNRVTCARGEQETV